MLKTLAITAVMCLALAGIAAADEVKITQVNKEFNPQTVTIKTGDTVDFVNGDTVAHNVFTQGSPHDFSLGTIKPGDDKPVTFTIPGTYNVRCAIHPKMKTTVTVQ